MNRITKPLAAMLFAAFTALPLACAAQIRIGVLVSSTGNGAVVGIPQKNSAALLPPRVADMGVEYTVLDDAGDPTNTVRNAKKLMSENHVDALIGPSLSPNAMAILGFIAEEKVPLIATVGTDAIIEPMDDKRRWAFKTTQTDDLICAALIAHMVKNKVKTAGFIGFADPYGENWYKVFSAQAQRNGIQIVANERFLRTDTSVVGQTAKIMQARPDVVLVGAAGGPTVLPHTTLVEAGFKGRIYQTHGAATGDFIRLGGARVEGTVLAAGPMLVIDEIPAANPIKAVTLKYIADYEKLYGAKPSTFGANTYDAGLILAKAIPVALKSGKPGTVEFRSALRDAIEQTHDLVGAQGVFNMTPANHHGMDERARVLVTVEGGKFKLLKD
jgi:branched-chain amino acid transport system substrate-binding protein